MPNKRVAFRADASLHIGTGHVMRCLTLADALQAQGAECIFICRPHPGHLLDHIAQRGHRALALPALGATNTTQPTSPSSSPHAHWLGTQWAQDAADTHRALDGAKLDWLVVDHYALDAQWEQAMQTACHRIMVIDDLADRPHHCNLLLDQNLGRTEADYRAAHPAGRIPASTHTLIGPQYALLRPEFAQLRPASLARRKQPEFKQLLITMGGVDKDNATGQVLDALKTCPLPTGLEITVVMGPHAPWLPQIKAQAQSMPWPTQVLKGVNNMAQWMANSDLAIGAAGGTAWERCCVGLPSVLLVQASNQHAGASALRNAGAAAVIEDATLISTQLPAMIAAYGSVEILQSTGLAASLVADGLGCNRVCTAMQNKTNTDHTHA